MTALDKLCTAENLLIENTRTAAPASGDWTKYPKARHWSCLLHYKGRRMESIEYHQGSAHKKPPTPADVLFCLISDAQCADGHDFEDFCLDLGYSPDSRKALTTYLDCQSTGRRLRTFLGKDFATFAEAAQDY
jgi:hypothetical protein